MKRWHIQGRTLAMIGVLVPLLALFAYVALRSGPLTPIQVTVAVVENQAITPSLFGIGTTEARYTYRIGPTLAGRVKQVHVDVGEMVRAGQLLGEMDSVDLDDRVAALDAALKSAAANVSAAEARILDVEARRTYAATQAQRFEKLLHRNAVSAESLETKQQELQVAEAGFASARANLEAARQEVVRVQAELDALISQRANLRLIAPMDGMVVAREAESGTTVVAGQSVLEIIDPTSLWINVRFDQLSASGLQPGLSAHIVLRSQNGRVLGGRVLRVEPIADSVTEEILAKVTFDSVPDPSPAVGELAEVTVALTALSSGPSIPNAAIQRIDGELGVWQVAHGDLNFTPIVLGAADLDGLVQVREGLKAGDHVVVHSAKALGARSRIDVVDQITGGKR